MGVLGGLWEAMRLCVRIPYVFTCGFTMGAGAPYFFNSQNIDVNAGHPGHLKRGIRGAS